MFTTGEKKSWFGFSGLILSLVYIEKKAHFRRGKKKDEQQQQQQEQRLLRGSLLIPDKDELRSSNN